jgi:HAD superfamily hydrolase (TIGR01450 family)
LSGTGGAEATLGSSTEPLDRRYDLAMVDLDGVVYIGRDAVPGAPEHLEAARARMRIAFITNNAARPPERVAAHLRELGVQARADDVVTSAQAASRLLEEKLGAGARVVVLGDDGLVEAVTAAGLVPVEVDDDTAEAVVTGYGPEVRWRHIMRAAVRIRDGLWWVASNTDLTIPTPYGEAPGHGVLVDTVRRFSRVEPVVAGKPSRPLLDETMRRCGGDHPLMVGDRLDTDIAGAHEAGVDSLLVMTGVTGLSELVAAGPRLRPTFISADLGGLSEPHPRVEVDGRSVSLGGWTVRTDAQSLRVAGDGNADDWWRAVAAVSWSHLDDTGRAIGIEGVTPPG